jgi:enoyl-[acyl-carrier-protein] reductase (NADH)
LINKENFMAVNVEAGSDQAPYLVVAGAGRTRRSLGWEVTNRWLATNDENMVIATVKSDRSAEFVEKEAKKLGEGRVTVLQIDWVNPQSPDILHSALTEILGDERALAGAVHSVAGTDNENFELPPHEVDAEAYLKAIDISAVSLVRLIKGALPHIRPNGGIVTIGFDNPGTVVEGYGGPMTAAKGTLEKLVDIFGNSLGHPDNSSGQPERLVRTASIIPGFVPTVSAKGGVLLTGHDSADVERNFAEGAALAGTDGTKQREALGYLTVAFMTNPGFSEMTGVHLDTSGGWFLRRSLVGQSPSVQVEGAL